MKTVIGSILPLTRHFFGRKKPTITGLSLFPRRPIWKVQSKNATVPSEKQHFVQQNSNENGTYLLDGNFSFFVERTEQLRKPQKLTICQSEFGRYRAILYPLKPKLSRCYILATIFGIWISSSLLALPALLYSRTFSNG